MPRNLLIAISNFAKNLERILLPHHGPPPEIAFLLHQPITPSTRSSQNFSLRDLIGDGILWAVPKHRRSVEKRLSRKFGYPEYVWKPLKEKRNLRNCQHCGHDHELGILCPHCYNKVKQETQLMQEKIQSQLGLDPVEKEVVVLYDGETAEQSTDSVSGKRVVEMKKPRPLWFTKNLMQKSTQQSSDTKEVKPSNLG